MSSLTRTYLEHYVSADGGGKLSPTDTHTPFPGCMLTTTANENPILFLVQSAIQLLKTEPAYYYDFQSLYFKHMASTQIVPGLHSRRCGDEVIRRQSHDNVVAMAIGGWYFNSHHAKSICEYASTRLWNYNVMGTHAFDLKSQIQGGDIAICRYAAEQTPNVVCLMWLAIGLITTKAFNLADLRIEFLEDIMSKLPILHRLVLKAAIYLHRKRRGPRINWVRAYFKGSEHPMLLSVESEHN